MGQHLCVCNPSSPTQPARGEGEKKGKRCSPPFPDRDRGARGVRTFKVQKWHIPRNGEHPVFETTLVRAKHSDYQLLVLTERLFALMLRP